MKLLIILDLTDISSIMNNKNKNHNQQSNRIKKNCFGNRKLQKLRAKLRKRGFDVQSIMILVNVDNTNKSISKESNCQHQETIIRFFKQQKQFIGGLFC